MDDHKQYKTTSLILTMSQQVFNVLLECFKFERGACSFDRGVKAVFLDRVVTVLRSSLHECEMNVNKNRSGLNYSVLDILKQSIMYFKDSYYLC